MTATLTLAETFRLSSDYILHAATNRTELHFAEKSSKLITVDKLAVTRFKVVGYQLKMISPTVGSSNFTCFGFGFLKQIAFAPFCLHTERVVNIYAYIIDRFRIGALF